MNGFYVPDSISSSYVANKRKDDGSFQYDSAANEVGISKQQAIQTIENNYAQTIENAYSSYLGANKSVLGSQMGQGYKEAYLENQRQQLQAEIAQANLSAAQYRQELGSQEAQAQAQITKTFQTEVSNFDRAAASMQEYLNYVKTLTDAETGNSYLSAEQNNYGVDELYHVLFNAQPVGSIDAEGNQKGYFDTQGNAGMNFLTWARNNLGNTNADEDYRQWLFGQGGYQELRTQLSAKSQAREDERNRKIEEQQTAAEKEYKDEVNSSGFKVMGSSTATDIRMDGKIYGFSSGSRVAVKDDALNEKLTKLFTHDKDSNPVYGSIVYYNGSYYRYDDPSNRGKWTEYKDSGKSYKGGNTKFN